jgi:hypothetical protein
MLPKDHKADKKPAFRPTSPRELTYFLSIEGDKDPRKTEGTKNKTKEIKKISKGRERESLKKLLAKGAIKGTKETLIEEKRYSQKIIFLSEYLSEKNPPR